MKNIIDAICAMIYNEKLNDRICYWTVGLAIAYFVIRISVSLIFRI